LSSCFNDLNNFSVELLVLDGPAGEILAIEDGLKPARTWFFAALKCARPNMNQIELVLWYASLWAQISFYSVARKSILRRVGKNRYDQKFLNAAAHHLVRAMLAQLL